MEHAYLPATGPYVIDPGPWRHPIHWFDRETSVFYPRVLLSYAVWRDAVFPYQRDDFETILGDSGGYSVVTLNVNINPDDVIRWQVKHCTRGLILDIPPYRPGRAIQLLGKAAEYWEDSLRETVINVKRALPYYVEVGDRPFRWWGVVQGQTREQMEEWHGRISEVYPFDGAGEGWALSAKPSTDLLCCTRHMRFAYDRGLRRVHVLQVGGTSTLGVILGLAALSGSFDLVTYDVATALRLAVTRGAVIHKGVGIDYLNEITRAGETTVTDYLRQCPCQACAWLREDWPLSNRELPHYLLLHNHLTLVEAYERIYCEAVSDPDWLLRRVTGKLYGRVMREWEKVSR